VRTVSVVYIELDKRIEAMLDKSRHLGVISDRKQRELKKES
jgi:hypothetical protein